MCTYKEPSLYVRQDIAIQEVPRLAEKAAVQALAEWGQSRDTRDHSRRLRHHQRSEHAQSRSHSNQASGSEFHEHLDNLVGSAIFVDGAACVIIGSDPEPELEKPQFEIHWSGETILPESDDAIEGRLTEAGLIFHLLKDVPGTISRNTLPIFAKADEVAGSPGWNDLFWCVHPGGRAILDEVEKTLSLKPETLRATSDVFLVLAFCSCLIKCGSCRLNKVAPLLDKVVTGV
ncbi:hypothetical protein R1flu_015499 [Riccia fluitans]|uniref:Chalcone synthase n=1 Tax=Riccia fluitans TaxID=41844 RepID=A0ABD1YJ38_9MARC